MDPKKLLIFALFGVPALLIAAILIAIGGVVGGGLSVLLAGQFGNPIIATLAGALCSGIAFHFFFTTLIGLFRQLNEEDGTGKPAPGNGTVKGYTGNHLYGSLSYFAATIIGVSLAFALFNNPTLVMLAAIGLTGVLGLAGLALVGKLGLFKVGMPKKAR